LTNSSSPGAETGKKPVSTHALARHAH
jgi:hypothetical protein